MDGPLLLTVPEAAELLRLSRNGTYELIARGEIPSIRLGRSIRVPRSALDAWLLSAAGRVSGELDPAAVS